MKFIGKYGEHAVMLNLLKLNIEAYLAIKSNQEDYDITVVINNSNVKRIQVKSTILQNKNTNNSIDGTEKKYDYLAILIRDNEKDRFFVLSKADADAERGSNAKLGVSKLIDKESFVKDNLIQYENLWSKIA